MAYQPDIAVSVIVPAYNAADTLGACLKALLDQTFPRERYEIIVVDDGSTDGTAEAANRLGVIVIRQLHRGPGAARNTGIRRAQGHLLCFTDADCMPTRNWIEAMAAPFTNPEIAGCKGIYRTRQRKWISRFVQLEYEKKYRSMERSQTIDFIDTYSAAYRKSVFLKEGFFPEDVLAAEDAEFSFRLAERGYKLVFNPQAAVYHKHAETLRHYLRRKFRYGKWRFQVYLRHPRKIEGDSHTPRSLRWELLLTALMVCSAPFAFFYPLARWILGSSAAAFTIITAPFVVHAWQRDWPAACISPLMLWLRAAALGMGLATGLCIALKRRISNPPQSPPWTGGGH